MHSREFLDRENLEKERENRLNFKLKSEKLEWIFIYKAMGA